MKPDEKYMSEVNSDTSFRFIPPSFNRSMFMDDDTNDKQEEDESLDLFPDETSEDQLYCYYNALNGCNSKKIGNTSLKRGPATFEILRSLDLEINETSDTSNSYFGSNIDKIYSEILSKDPGIYEAFSTYGVPDPICKVITKKLIKLSLLYNNKE